MANLFSPGKNQEQKVFLAVVKGALISIPILFVFILLFSSADLVFKKYFARLITLNISPEIVLRAILILGATLICLGAYSYLFRQTISQKKGENKRLLGYIETSTLLFLVNALFFLFILIQAAYLFGGQSNISSQGFTYAEYARRGFFELIAVAVISLLLLLTTEKYTRNNHAPAFKILSAILIVQVILIMASAFIRLSLYEEAYGLTTLRLYSHAFIILLAVIFGFLFYKICKGREEDYFAFRTFLTLLFFLIAMNFLDPDAFIARCNIKRFASTGKIDIGYLSRLSDDAIPDIIESLDQLDESSKKSLVYELSQRAKKNSSPSLSSWQSLNLSRLRAKKLLNTKIGDLRQYQNSRLAQPEE